MNALSAGESLRCILVGMVAWSDTLMVSDDLRRPVIDELLYIHCAYMYM